MSIQSVRTLIQEKFAYTTDMENIKKDGYPVGPDKKEPQKAAHPMEKFRNVVKAILGASTTEEDAELENVIDFKALFRLASKHGLSPLVMQNLETIKVELEKPKGKRDSDIITISWDAVKDNIPYWFLGVLPSKVDEAEEDKKLVTQLLDVMSYFNKVSEKAGKENAKNTEHAGRDTLAKKNLDKARKDLDIDLEAGSEKKLSKKFKNELDSVEQYPEQLEVPESDSEKETPKKNEDKYKA